MPAWPLDDGSAEELEFWGQVWATPQAARWVRLGWTRTVARYARMGVAAEERGASAALLAEVRQLEDRLGLNPMSMARLRWDVADDETAAVRSEHPRKSARERMRLVAVDPAEA